MLTMSEFDAIERRLLDALRAKLGVRSRSLAKGMKRAGRRLPRDAHRAARVLKDARLQAQHPKLSRLVDETSLKTAEATVMRHLDKINPSERRKDAILSLLGSLAINVLAVVALVVGLMYWRGLL